MQQENFQQPPFELHLTPQQHAGRILQMLQDAYYECRMDAGRVHDAQAQALFSSVADTLSSAIQMLSDYYDQYQSEMAWRNTGPLSNPAPPASLYQSESSMYYE